MKRVSCCKGTKRVGVIFLAILMVLGLQVMPWAQEILLTENQVHGLTTGMVTAESVGDESGIQGDKGVKIMFRIDNGYGTEKTISNMNLDLGGLGITVSGNAGSVTIPSNQFQNISFQVDISKSAATGDRTGKFTADIAGSPTEKVQGNINFNVYEKLATPDNKSDKYVAAVEITQKIEPTTGFVSGDGNKLKLDFLNFGNTLIKNAQVSLTLPEGLSVYNASNSVSLGYFSTGQKKNTEFPITVASGVESKNYPIEVEVSGLDYGDIAISTKKTFYIPVQGSGAVSSTKTLDITNINVANQVLAQEDFTLSFSVENRGTSAVKNVKVYAEIPEGLLNKTKNTFIEASIPAGGSKNYSMTLYASATTEKTYPIKIAVEPTSGTDAAANGVMQYASVFVKNIGNGNIKTPQIIVDRYSYGGTYVQAGSEFKLNLGLYNTSGKTLSNIKVNLNSTDGIFVPVDSSNSFFIDSIDKKGHLSKSLILSVKPAAEQKTTSLEVNMTYEDGAGNEFSSKDVISIPVMQKTRLQVDELVPPMEVYVGMPASTSVQFYNMGKTVLSNLRVNATGDFDTDQSISYFVGNMEAGKSDTYDFSFIPRKGGPVEGLITFTYEDVEGKEQTYSVPFSFEAMADMPVMEEDPTLNEEQKPGMKKYLKWIIGGAVVVSAGTGGVVFRKIRKKKLHQEMEIDE